MTTTILALAIIFLVIWPGICLFYLTRSLNKLHHDMDRLISHLKKGGTK